MNSIFRVFVCVTPSFGRVSGAWRIRRACSSHGSGSAEVPPHAVPGWAPLRHRAHTLSPCPPFTPRDAQTMADSAPNAGGAAGGAAPPAPAGAAGAWQCCQKGLVRRVQLMCFTRRPAQPSPADITRILSCPHTPYAVARWLEYGSAVIYQQALRQDFSALDSVLDGCLTDELKEAIKREFINELEATK